MANCAICGDETEAGKYVRAKSLVRVGERRGREVHEAAPADEHGFYCLEHPLEQIEERINKEHPPSTRVPLRVVWNPAKGITVPRSFGVDIDQEVLNKAGLTEDQFHSRKGMRGIVVKSKEDLRMSLPLLVPPVCIWDQDTRYGLRHIAKAQGWKGK